MRKEMRQKLLCLLVTALLVAGALFLYFLTGEITDEGPRCIARPFLSATPPRFILKAACSQNKSFLGFSGDFLQKVP